jgi:hypothetical protein
MGGRKESRKKKRLKEGKCQKNKRSKIMKEEEENKH